MGCICSKERGPNGNYKEEDNIFLTLEKYEEELNSNFKYFDIFWYNPNKSNDFNRFKKCFENVQFYVGYSLESTLKFFKKESSYDWIVITPGSKGEELIRNLEQCECIKSFFIYCWNTQIHETWARNRKKIGCLTSKPKILCQKLIELNKPYLIPNFKYKDENQNDILLNFKVIDSKNKFAINSVKREIEDLKALKKKLLKKYDKFCIKSLYYLSGNEYENDFQEPVEELTNLYLFAILFKEMGKKFFQKRIKFIRNLTLLSLYFSQYQYLFSLVTFKNIKHILDWVHDENSDSNASYNETMQYYLKNFDGPGDLQNKAESFIDYLGEKLMNKECILDQKNKLKDIQFYCILTQIETFAILNSNLNDFFTFHHIINLFRDLDFCLKLLVVQNYSILNNKNHNFIDEAVSSLLLSDRRFFIYYFYMEQFLLEPINGIQQKINKSLIKDFIIIGNKQFQEKIKPIENDLEAKSIKYLIVEEIYNYIKEKNNKDKKKEKDKNLLVFYYYLIIQYEEFQKNIEKIILLSAELGITFIVFLYIENKDKNIIFHKSPINYIISIILVYSLEDILNFIKTNIKVDFSEYNSDIIYDFLNIKIPKINFKQEEEEISQNGCFELAESFDINLIQNIFIVSAFDIPAYGIEIPGNIYNMYKEHNALELFFKYITYFGFQFFQPYTTLQICFIKRILYMYCREEIESQKSFYRMINDDLRTREPSKIYRNIHFLSYIYRLIENEELASYKGKVYRATKLDENLINKLVRGKIMVNTVFWSTSKSFEVAENFMKTGNWRNSYIICNANKNNIDIDYEKLNPFEEKEVLFLPFTEFRVENVFFEQKNLKKIFIIEVTELGNRNFVNYDNLQVKNIPTFNIMGQIKKVLNACSKLSNPIYHGENNPSVYPNRNNINNDIIYS